MNGISHPLDTNIIFGVLKGDAEAVRLAQGIDLSDCAYSAITRIELLGFPGITGFEEQAINGLLARMGRVTITPEIEEAAIRLRRHRRLKLPDAVIMATASVHGLELLTLDKRLAGRQPQG